MPNLHQRWFNPKNEGSMKVNDIYTLNQIQAQGLTEHSARELNAKVYLNGDKVYFFELIDNQQAYRLYSIINKRSFFL